jgi:hypothetical protein
VKPGAAVYLGHQAKALNSGSIGGEERIDPSVALRLYKRAVHPHRRSLVSCLQKRP